MITVHWTHAVILVAMLAAITHAYIDGKHCGDYGMPLMGCLSLLAAVVLGLALLLAKSWGWV